MRELLEGLLEELVEGQVMQQGVRWMAGLNVGEGARGAQEVETDAKDEAEDDAVEVTGEGDLVLVQHNTYKWPGLIVGREGTQVEVRLFNKLGLKGRLTLVDQDDVTEFVYSDELALLVNNSNNNELKYGFKKALEFK